MGIQLGICGTGAFADCFIPLFKAHPLVDEVILCDLDADKLKAKSEKFGLPHTLPSLDALCKSNVDAIAIITQNTLHGPQAIQALESGKHVYSAVPSAITVDEITRLVKTVERTRLVYMIGETSYYYPCTIYCRQRFQQGAFGHVVYAEAEYYHDYSHGLYEVYQWRFGKDWKQYYGQPPMHYPTHSTSMVVSVTGAHVTHVSGMGFVDRHEDALYQQNVWNNPFSNETMLCRMSDGSMARFNEFRRIGHPGTVGMSMYGTEGGYEEQVNGQTWITKDLKTCIDLRDQLKPEGVPADASGGIFNEVARIHPIERLPRSFVGLPNGHLGSHQFLVDDFVNACVNSSGTACCTYPNNVWQAARYLIPGLIAHESAMAGGVLLEVPDLGDAPSADAK